MWESEGKEVECKRVRSEEEKGMKIGHEGKDEEEV